MRIDREEFVADELLPGGFVEIAGLIRASLRPRPPIDLMDNIRTRVLTGVLIVLAAQQGEQQRPIKGLWVTTLRNLRGQA